MKTLSTVCPDRVGKRYLAVPSTLRCASTAGMRPMVWLSASRLRAFWEMLVMSCTSAAFFWYIHPNICRAAKAGSPAPAATSFSSCMSIPSRGVRVSLLFISEGKVTLFPDNNKINFGT